MPKPRTFFSGTGDQQAARGRRQTQCSVCGRQHGVWACTTFSRMSVSRRWEAAKRDRFCFCCLGTDHVEHLCPRSRPCDPDSCSRHHHRLLPTDDQSSRQATGVTPSTATQQCQASELQSSTLSRTWQAPTEGKRTLVAAVPFKTVAMRTVPVVLKAGGRRVTVNALLDDASTPIVYQRKPRGRAGTAWRDPESGSQCPERRSRDVQYNASRNHLGK